MSTEKHTFFCEDLNFGILDEDESGHAVRVLRLTEGNLITVIDGKGRSVIAKITSASKREVGFDIVEEHPNTEQPLRVHIGIAPTKNIDRFTFFLEKVTEMGIMEMTPILSANSERKVIKIDKLEKGLISAIKQSGNLFLPQLNELTDLKTFILQDHGNAQKFIAHCAEDTEKVEFKDVINTQQNIVILIGPEGDFTPEEVKLAQENGFLSVSLGKSRLRTETAGILACHTVYLASY
ncbi:MAG: 16S rRNA (uracil(1498)-N(3))-methyltransferase [Crocinitomicaceae bacterium]|nr:16S rRNA (uracil(1498)-N(3))-methyltransferase [Crocinitomicaceae bacterium]